MKATVANGQTITQTQTQTQTQSQTQSQSQSQTQSQTQMATTDVTVVTALEDKLMSAIAVTAGECVLLAKYQLSTSSVLTQY